MSNTGVGDKDYYLKYYSQRDWSFYNHILAEIVKHSQPGPILDVGAGTGLLTEAANHWGFSCVGIEGSQDAIDIAKKRYPQINLSQLHLSNNFPFPDQSFQTVILNQVIEHLEPDIAKKTLQEIFRVLSPGGMLYLTSPSIYNRAEAKADPTHINLYKPGVLKDLLLTVGFTSVTPNNIPLSLLGNNKVGRGVMFVLFKIFPIERLSATANFFAFRS